MPYGGADKGNLLTFDAEIDLEKNQYYQNQIDGLFCLGKPFNLTHFEAKTNIHGLHHLLSSLRSVIVWFGESECTKMCSGQLDLSHLVQI